MQLGKNANYTRGKTAQYLSDPIVTIRNERYVLPVKATYRQKLVALFMTNHKQDKHCILNLPMSLI